MKKIFLLVIKVAAIISIVYLFGPAPARPVYDKTMPAINTVLNGLDEFVKTKEAKHKIKPGNKAQIVWASDSLKQKTEYAIVYLHGFTASKEEGNPVHINTAKKFGCNLYLARLSEHGLETDNPLLNLTADNYWESVKEALAIGKQLGHKIILMGTSTGASQALQLAAAYPNDIAALILYSPNIRVKDPNAWVANNHWGLQLGRMIMKSDFVTAKDQRDIYKKYWYRQYRLEGVVALQEFLETAMTNETFKKISQPALLLYYYKDEANQDNVVSVDAMLKMFDELATPADKKIKRAMPNTGDHVMASPIKSKDVEGVERETEKFLTGVLQMKY